MVPYTGHSVLGSDFSGCAEVAVEAFFKGARALPCGRIPNLFSPTPAIPRSLASTRTVDGLAGRPGRTLRAVLETMVDLDRQVIGATLQANAELPERLELWRSARRLCEADEEDGRATPLLLLPGVQLSGVLPVNKGEVGSASMTITGQAAADGHVSIGGAKASGVLGGRRFVVKPEPRPHLRGQTGHGSGRRSRSSACGGPWASPWGPLAHMR